MACTTLEGLKMSVLYQPHGKPVLLIVVVAVHLGVVVVQVAFPCVGSTASSRTPPVAVVAKVVERAIVVVAVARRQA